MQKIVTTAQMRNADEYTISVKGVPALLLMERAGKALAKEVATLITQGNVLVVCGGGNNGGDGFVCARLLLGMGYEVTTVCIATKKSELCQAVAVAYEKAGGKTLDVFPNLPFHCVVDCLLGTGFHGEPNEKYSRAIQRINAYKDAGAKIISADIPSGINGDNGSATVCVQADVCVCMGEIKAGVYLGQGIDASGKVVRADIGIQLPEDNYAEILDRESVAQYVPKRFRNTHKGRYGKAVIVGGSKQYFGAGFLSAYACLRAGAGYTFIHAPKSVVKTYLLRLPEAIYLNGLKNVLDKQSVAYGMGLGVSRKTAKGLLYLLKNYTGKLLIDADGINALAKYCKDNLDVVFANKKCDVVCTPHVKEFSRISGKEVKEIQKSGLFACVEFAKKHNVTMLLKGATTVITDGERICVNTAGSVGQAKGGSGDALSGVITALLAQGVAPFEATCAGAYWVGTSAKLTESKYGQYGMLASDVIDGLGNAVAYIQGEV